VKPTAALSLVAAGMLLLATGCRGTVEQPLEVFGTVPEFALTAHTGQPFDSAQQLRGRVWVVDFIFTNCQGPCPRMTSQMRQVQNALTDFKDLRLISITVDPARDNPEVLAAYATRQKADARWFFLTGPMETLHKLKREVFFLGNVDGQLNHSTRFVLVDQQSRIRAFYDTSDPESIPNLIAAIRRLHTDPSP
jgi:protein SCO1/2